ncbi:MAG: hypothetical protein AB7G08_23070 [Hyphomicrobiaceae bacterium]
MQKKLAAECATRAPLAADAAPMEHGVRFALFPAHLFGRTAPHCLLPVVPALRGGLADRSESPCHSHTSGSRKQVLHKFSGRFPVTKMFSVDRVPAGWAVVQARHFADGALSAIESS